MSSKFQSQETLLALEEDEEDREEAGGLEEEGGKGEEGPKPGHLRHSEAPPRRGGEGKEKGPEGVGGAAG